MAILILFLKTDVKRYETEMVTFVKQKYPNLLKEISDKKAIGDDTKKELVNALNEFKAIFQPTTK